MATIHVHGSQPPAARADDRAQPPIRWPHPNRYSAFTIALWGLGLIIALLIPASIVPLSQKAASVADVWTAFGFTVLGALIMMGATGWRFRMTKDSGILLLGIVPATSIIIGGVILATVKVLGFV
jgi:hypothetical protein